MKNKLLKILSFLLIFPLVIMSSACGASKDPDSNGDTHTHSWSETWTRTESEHYKTCSGCDEKKDKSNHNFVNDVCSVCSYIKHDHQYGSNYEKDSTYHWRKCTFDCCSQIIEKQSHSFGQNNICEGCLYENIPVVNSIRDLKVFYVRCNSGDMCKFIELPDDKLMMIGLGLNYTDNLASFWWQYNNWDYSRSISEKGVDYLVLANMSDQDIGDDFSLNTGEYKFRNFYYPDDTNWGYYEEASKSSNTYGYSEYLERVEGLKEMSDNNYAISDECVINNKFIYNGTTYEYTIKITAPLGAENCQTYFDESLYVYIEYQGREILIADTPTKSNLKSYVNSYCPGKTRDFDMFFSYLVDYSFEPNLVGVIPNISSSTGYFICESLGLGEGDYMGYIASPWLYSYLEQVSREASAFHVTLLRAVGEDYKSYDYILATISADGSFSAGRYLM